MVTPVRFCRTPDGIQIAYRTAGSGPPIVFPAWWYTHQDLLWELPPARAFFDQLARRFTVVTYDKPGCGLSDRDRPAFTLEEQVSALETVVESLKVEQPVLFGFSMAGAVAVAYAVRHPERVAHLILFDTKARTPPAEDPTQAAAVWEASKALTRAHWGLGSSVLIQISVPGAGPELVDWHARHMRAAVAADTAIAMVERSQAIDVTSLLPQVCTPTLVLHRRDDASFPFALGRELAAGIPGAQFVPMEGAWHAFYEHEEQDVAQHVLAYLEDRLTPANRQQPRQPGAANGLSVREVEVLRLIAVGKSNREIAARLVISENTVFQHVRSIFNKTGCANRTEAAAYALRHGLVE